MTGIPSNPSPPHGKTAQATHASQAKSEREGCGTQMGRGIDLGTRQSRKENPGDSSKKVLLRPLYPSSQAAQGRCHHPIRKARRRQPQGTAGGCPARAWWARRGGHIPLLSAQSSKQHWPPLQMEKLRLGGGMTFPEPQKGKELEQSPRFYSKGRAFAGPRPQAVSRVGGATEADIPTFPGPGRQRPRPASNRFRT